MDSWLSELETPFDFEAWFEDHTARYGGGRVSRPTDSRDLEVKEMDTTAGSGLRSVAPFFIVDDLSASVRFYRSQLGFDLDALLPGDDPFFAIVRRGPVSVMLKEIGRDVHPVPNPTRHEWARWDAFVSTPDPDALFEEFRAKGVSFHSPLADTDDGLRAFEVSDNSGYVLCFGRPSDDAPG